MCARRRQVWLFVCVCGAQVAGKHSDVVVTSGGGGRATLKRKAAQKAARAHRKKTTRGRTHVIQRSCK